MSPHLFGDGFPTIESIIKMIFDETRYFQGGVLKLSGIIFTMLLSIELIKEAINLASGRGFNLDKKILSLIIVGVATTAVYPSFSESMYNKMGIQLIKPQIVSMEKAQTKMRGEIHALNVVMNYMQAPLPVVGALGGLFRGINHLVLILILMILNIAISLVIVTTYAAYCMVLTIGPLFIVFFVLEETRNWFFLWLSHIVSFIAQILFLGMALQVGSVLISKSINVISKLQAGEITSIGISYWRAINGPLIAIGLMMVAIRVARSLTGAGGGTELFGPLGAAWGAIGRVGSSVATGGVGTAVRGIARM